VTVIPGGHWPGIHGSPRPSSLCDSRMPLLSKTASNIIQLLAVDKVPYIILCPGSFQYGTFNSWFFAFNFESHPLIFKAPTRRREFYNLFLLRGMN
jgi:hypothetical protein